MVPRPYLALVDPFSGGGIARFDVLRYGTARLPSEDNHLHLDLALARLGLIGDAEGLEG